MSALVRGLVRYDSRLVEEAVLRAVDRGTREAQGSFRARRDVLYEINDGDERDAAFEALHGEWFVRLGLDAPLHDALARQRDVAAGVAECRVLTARRHRDELADLVDGPTAVSRPVLVVKLRAESLLDADATRSFLRRELLHVADMLDPAFGYQRELPVSDRGPSHDERLRDRYRAVWAASVAGRLGRAERGRLDAPERVPESFARAFGVLREGVGPAYQRWFSERGPTHAAIVDFIHKAESDL